MDYFVSDIHIENMESERAQKFLQFLNDLNAKKPDQNLRLFFVGDIFDLWVHDYKYFQKKFAPIINEVRRFLKNGNKLIYFEGNHDLYLKSFWQYQLRATVVSDFEYFKCANHNVRVEHGDLSDPEDKGYLFLRAFLRNEIVSLILKNLPGFFIAWLGQKMSATSRKYTSEVKTTTVERSKNKIRTYAKTCYEDQPFQIFVTGHTHVFDDYEGDGFRSINLGTWLDQARFLVINDEGQIEIRNV